MDCVNRQGRGQSQMLDGPVGAIGHLLEAVGKDLSARIDAVDEHIYERFQSIQMAQEAQLAEVKRYADEVHEEKVNSVMALHQHLTKGPGSSGGSTMNSGAGTPGGGGGGNGGNPMANVDLSSYFQNLERTILVEFAKFGHFFEDVLLKHSLHLERISALSAIHQEAVEAVMQEVKVVHTELDQVPEKVSLLPGPAGNVGDIDKIDVAVLDPSANGRMGPKVTTTKGGEVRSSPAMGQSSMSQRKNDQQDGPLMKALRSPSEDSGGAGFSAIAEREYSRRMEREPSRVSNTVMDRETSREHFSRKLGEVHAKLDELRSHEMTVEKRLEEVHIRLMKDLQPKLAAGGLGAGLAPLPEGEGEQGGSAQSDRAAAILGVKEKGDSSEAAAGGGEVKKPKKPGFFRRILGGSSNPEPKPVPEPKSKGSPQRSQGQRR